MKILVILTALVLLANGDDSSETESSTESTTHSATQSTTQSTTKSTVQPVQRKNLTFVLSGRKIPTQDGFSAVDAYVKVTEVSAHGVRNRIGNTAFIRDDENPEWDSVFWVMWQEGTGQKLEFSVVDHDILDSDDDAGSGSLDLDEFARNNQNLTLPLSKGGELIVQGTQPVRFNLYARKIPRLDVIKGDSSEEESHSDVFVKVYWRKGKYGKNHKFATSTVIDNEENPEWPEVIEFANYQKGTDQYLYFKVRDQDVLTRNDKIGDLLIEADSYVNSGTKLTSKLQNSDGNATLSIVPVGKVHRA